MPEIGLIAMPPLVAANTGIVTLAPQRSMVSIAVYRGRLDPLQDALGVMLPVTPHRVTANGVSYLWSGPSNWLAISASDATDFDLEMAARTDGLAAVTDQSDGRVVLRVQGDRARDVMAKLVPIDLHPRVFTLPATALTLAGHIAVQIWQTDDGAYELACFRSLAETLYEALIEASREFEGMLRG